MPIWLIGLLFGLSNLLWLGSAIWLLLHLTAFASLFRGHADIVASPKRPKASRAQVMVAIFLFAAGIAGSFIPMMIGA